MKMFKAVTAVCGLVLMGSLITTTAKADEWNQKTVVTFNGPVEIPGVHVTGWGVLPAGTYVFKLLDSPADRHIVQIFNQDQTKLLTTVLAVPNYRLKATNKTVITFRERPAGEPEALKAWFYPGHQWGEHFVYERPRAIQLAKETNETVLSTPVALAEAPVEVLKTAPVEAVNPSGETVEAATVVEAPPAEVAAAVTPAPELVASLPQTASYLPLIGLAGLLMLAAGFALSGLLKHTA